MKSKALINDISIRFYVYCRHIFPYAAFGACLYFLLSSNSHAEGTNYLTGLKGDVKATFGAGSDTEYFILLAEGLGGAYAFWKSKSMPVLLGLPVLMVFTHWALK